MSRSRGQPGRDQRSHAGREGKSQVDLWQAEEAPVRPHHPVVVGEDEHRARGEGVTLQRRDTRHSHLEHAGEQLVDSQQERRRLLALGGHPFKVKAARPVLSGRGCHECTWCGRFDLAQATLELIERAIVEPVLVVPEVQDEDVAVTV